MIEKKKILVTCPPMLQVLDKMQHIIKNSPICITAPNVVQTLTELELKELVPEHDGWIIGDDPATRGVFKAGVEGRLKAAVKWGVGVDNIDFKACEDLGIPIKNTPNVFGADVADIAIGYLIGLARNIYGVDRGVRSGEWLKIPGESINGKSLAIVGYGDIGRNICTRAIALGLNVLVYDPFINSDAQSKKISYEVWPHKIQNADFLIIACTLNSNNRHIINEHILSMLKPGVKIINVSRGALIDQNALIDALEVGRVGAAALDVYEYEPLPQNSKLRKFENIIFGTHNASNTLEGSLRVSIEALNKITEMLKNEKK